ncbi:hypothetical protein FF011L_22940 [Roseimaritima multifibrata]|uniref:Urease accessory protein UreH-like transmembrane domain-containing protein n=1 Tax=Roseimaritima multifibrata TaxID=1930274 RepID=A0A517MF60_9BACT|nr:sulfite exporter TauE/SafE family protein [Roseimaritima multifibrata]QDS93524.1 hypothetical protein FF011L_22940 [Roseimaritima multifibrata]
MWILLAAVLTASVLGSMHCVGMCGPLAIWASGAGERQPRKTVFASTSLYHFGRLLTYTLVGFAAGAIGSFVDWTGDAVGFQIAAARTVGGVMIVLGVFKLRALLVPPPMPTDGHSPPASKIGGLLVRLRPYIFQLPIPLRAVVTGLLTTLLPCGWLYMFALFAAGTGSPVTGGLVMAAFWLGSVPALVGLVAGTQVLARRFTRLVPIAASLLLILTGCFTTSGRGFANLQSLTAFQNTVQSDRLDGESDPAALLQRVRTVGDAPLPCCEDLSIETEPS